MSLLAVALAAAPQALPADQPERELWIPDDLVRALAYDGGTLYVGGTFSLVGPATGAFSPVDAATGEVPAAFPRIAGTVFDAVPDGLGGWFVAGDFQQVDESTCRHVAHVLADGTLDDWCAGVGGPVNAIARKDDMLFLGGAYEDVAGQPRQRLAAVSALDGALLPWNPCVAADLTSAEVIFDLEVAGDAVYLAGNFQDTLIGGAGRRYAAAVDATTGLALPFHPAPNAPVRALDVAGDRVYLGGDFTLIGTVHRGRVAEVDATTGAPTPLNPGASSTVLCVERAGDTLFLGGLFDEVGTTPRTKIAAVDVVTGALLPFAPHVDLADMTSTSVRDLAVHEERLFLVGSFLTVNGARRAHAAEVDPVTGATMPWTANASGPPSTEAWCVVPLQGAIGIGGEFTSVGGVFRSGLAALDVATGRATEWAPKLSAQLSPWKPGVVNDLAVSGDTLLVFGGFSYVNGVPAEDAARLDLGTGDLEPGFACTVTAAGGSVDQGLEHDGAITLLGFVAGPTSGFVAQVDAATGDAQPSFDLTPNNRPLALVRADASETLYLGGRFVELEDAFGLHTRRRVAAVHPSTGEVQAFDPDADDEVAALALRDDTLFVGGSFDLVGGSIRRRIAAVDATTGALQSWDPVLGGSGTGWGVDLLLPYLDTIFAFGGFSSVGGQGYPRAAAIDALTAAPLGWSPALNSGPEAAVIGGGRLFAGGSFSTAGGIPVWNLAAFQILSLRADVEELSVSAGGAQTLDVATGSELAGDAYWIAGTLSGTEPGFELLGQHVPLNVDAYTLLLLGPGLPLFTGAVGTLDASGGAQAVLTLPAGSNPAFAGLTLHHAAAVYDAGAGALELVTNAVPLVLAP